MATTIQNEPVVCTARTFFKVLTIEFEPQVGSTKCPKHVLVQNEKPNSRFVYTNCKLLQLLRSHIATVAPCAVHGARWLETQCSALLPSLSLEWLATGHLAQTAVLLVEKQQDASVATVVAKNTL